MVEVSLEKKCNIKAENIFTIKNEMLDFLKRIIMPNINNWDIVIKINRKGVAIFDDLKENFKELVSINQTQSIKIDFLGENFFKGKNVLLFDDSIRTGEQIETEINKINKYGIKTLSVAAILARKDTIENLSIKYPEIKFYIQKILIETEYHAYFYKYMIGFFDYINKPLSSDIPVLSINIPVKMSQTEVKSLFDDLNYEVEVVTNFLEYPDRFKMDVFFQNVTKYNEMIVNTGSLIDNLKVRLFVHVSDSGTTIFMELIVIPIGNLENCSGDFDWCLKKELKANIKLTKKNKNDHLCLLCVSQRLVTGVQNDLQNMLGKRLSSHGIIYNTKYHEWAFITE